RDHGVIVDEEILDRLAPVAEAQDEVLESVGRVAAHDVPKDRMATDRDHGLGQIVRDPTNAGPLSAAKDNGLHASAPTICSRPASFEIRAVGTAPVTSLPNVP